MEHIGLRLKQARINLELSLERAESLTGIDQSNLVKIEAGRRLPSESNLIALSKLYSIPINQLRAWKILSKLTPEVMSYVRVEIARSEI